MLTLKLLLTVSALCLWGDKPAKPSACCTATATICCGSQDGQVVVVADGKKLLRVRSGAPRVIYTTPDDSKLHVWTAGPDGILVIPDGTKVAGKPSGREIYLVPHAGNLATVWSVDDDESIADRIRAPRGSDTWIGVRMAPIPAALAAHLGDSGLLVANVAKGSPADKAGLRQYDVITKFGRAQINSTEDLVNAIAENGKSRTRMTVLRGGKEKSVRIKPAARPDAGDVGFKYDEPQDAVVNDSVQFRGKMLLPGKDGRMILRDLGDLKGLPGMLKSLENLKGMKGFHWNIDGEDFEFDFDMDDFKFDHKFGIGIPHLLKFGDGDFDFDGNFEFKIKTDNDGETIEIERNDDGEIVLRRTDADGNVTTETFDSFGDLHDSDAAEIFGKHRIFIGGGPGGKNFSFGWPGNLKNLPKMRMLWRKQIDEALEDVEEQLKGAHIKIQKFRDADGDESSRSMSVSVANGKVVVVINADGDVNTYQYDSIEDLKADNPDLWEELRDVLGDDDDDDD